MPHIIESLENALRLWEDNCFIINVLGRFENKLGRKATFDLQGPFINFGDLREYIIKSFNELDPDDFYRKFIEIRKPNKPFMLGDLADLPFELCLWAHNSRRVYHLKSDLQLMLNATSINNVCWQDVKLPFESFAVILDEPIIGTAVKQTYDCIIVSSYQAYDYKVLSFRLLSTEIKNYTPLSDEDKVQMLKLLKKDQFDKLKKAISKSAKAIPDNIFIPKFEVPLTPTIEKAKVSCSIMKLAKQFLNEQQDKGIVMEFPKELIPMPEEGNTAIRIVVGLCLFLTTQKTPQYSKYKYVSGKKNRQNILLPITDQSDIFKMTLGQNLSVREKNSFSTGLKRSGGYVVEPHFRQGTWRFPPKKAKDPYAEKTIWVRPTFVNAHLCPKGLPNGSETNIKP